MSDRASLYIFESARPVLDCKERMPRYGKHNLAPCRIIASKGSPGKQLHQVEFQNGVKFWVSDEELRKEA